MKSSFEDMILHIFEEVKAAGVELINLDRKVIEIKQIKKDSLGFYITEIGKKKYFSTGDLDLIIEKCDEAIAKAYEIQ